MSWEIFQQGPEAYIPIFLGSLFITVLAYCAFPVLSAILRKKPIAKKKYKRHCYGANAAVLFLFLLLNGGTLNLWPYLLWTSIFIAAGIKILESDGRLIEDAEEEPQGAENPNAAKEFDKICFCRKCGEKLIDGSRFCRKCGTEIAKE